MCELKIEIRKPRRKPIISAGSAVGLTKSDDNRAMLTFYQ